jgi:uncharacterized protein YecE (DUF72 family)
MRFFVGTSGYSYKEWKGTFYPEKLPQDEMLSYYARQFPTVEINNTFYRMPKANVLKAWARDVPDTFRFVLKAHQTITHRKRLNNVAKETKDLLRATSLVNGRQATVLIQLPPNFKKDLPRLEAFLALLGKGARAAFEFRHLSWFDDEVYGCLRKKSCALCIADVDDSPLPHVVSTANWGYVRLRRERYSTPRLREWVKRLKAQAWKETFVFFKHEDSGTGPRFATRFMDLAGPE